MFITILLIIKPHTNTFRITFLINILTILILIIISIYRTCNTLTLFLIIDFNIFSNIFIWTLIICNINTLSCIIQKILILITFTTNLITSLHIINPALTFSDTKLIFSHTFLKVTRYCINTLINTLNSPNLIKIVLISNLYHFLIIFALKIILNAFKII